MVIAPRYRKLVAVLVGMLLAGVPAAGVHYWLQRHIAQQGANELDLAALRAVRLAENRISEIVSALSDLGARGVTGCDENDVHAMHEVAFAVLPVKELSIVQSDGTTRCTNLGVALGERQVLSVVANPYPHIVIEVLRLGERSEPVVRVRNTAGPGGAGIAAVVPADMFIPRTSSIGGPLTVAVSVRINTLDGTLIAERAATRSVVTDDLVSDELKSEDYGLVASVSMPRARLTAAYADMLLVVTLGTGTFAALIFALAAFALWRRRDDPVASMQRALRKGEFVPYYQPVIDLMNARIVGAEVLVRWRKADGTLVSPAHFIPLAESTGLIVELTRDLMRRVCVEAGEAIGQRPGFYIGFNVTARHFDHEAVIDDVRAIFSASPIALSQVHLEVTERQPLESITTARRVISGLQALGVRVGIDDLGTGHSGLSYVLKLGVDFIKIDKIFVDAIGSERYSSTIIETLVGLARDMQMEIVAEGVETFEQVEQLRQHGIRRAQGYVFAPPLPGRSFLRLLQAVGSLPAVQSEARPLFNAIAAQRQTAAA